MRLERNNVNHNWVHKHIVEVGSSSSNLIRLTDTKHKPNTTEVTVNQFKPKMLSLFILHQRKCLHLSPLQLMLK